MVVEIKKTLDGRTPCEVYTRVMGYIRPVSGYNPGKKSEFYGRKYFEENAVDNSDFIKKYSNIKATK
jgi:hypothetical protein